MHIFRTISKYFLRVYIFLNIVALLNSLICVYLNVDSLGFLHKKNAIL